MQQRPMASAADTLQFPHKLALLFLPPAHLQVLQCCSALPESSSKNLQQWCGLCCCPASTGRSPVCAAAAIAGISVAAVSVAAVMTSTAGTSRTSDSVQDTQRDEQADVAWPQLNAVAHATLTMVQTAASGHQGQG